MDLQDFGAEVRPIIYERGEIYYESGSVISLKNDKNSQVWHAVVEGSDDYKVTVKLDDQIIVSSKCNCPYDYGDTCKHQVAVFLKLAEKLGLQKESAKGSKSSQNNLDDILDALNKDELIEIIKEHANWDEEFEADILLNYAIDDISKGEYIQRITTSIHHAMNRGFVPWNRTFEACRGAESVLDQANDFLKAEKYSHALAAAQAVLETLVPALQNTDDSSGEMGGCITESLEILKTISEHDLDENTRKNFFTYLINDWNIPRYDGWSWDTDLLKMAIDLHSGKKESEQLLQAVENCFRNGRIIEKYKWRESSFFQLKSELLTLMGRQKDAEKFFNENLHLPEFREKAIEQAFEHEKYSKVIQLADDGIISDTGYRGLINQWKVCKLKAYQKLDDTENIKTLSLEFLLNGKTSFYTTYKNTFSNEEWPEIYNGLINKLFKELNKSYPNSSLLGYILSTEHEYEKLLTMVQKCPKSISSYEDALFPLYPEEVLAINVENIRNQAESLKNRNDYASFCHYELAELCKTGGKELVIELIEEFEVKFKRRRAMLEELQKFRNKL